MNRTRIIVVLACVAAAAAVGLVVVPRLCDLWGPMMSQRATPPPPADVKNAVTLDRPGFTLRYPGNWTIDAADPGYDPDGNFTITSEGGSQISFVIHSEPRPAKAVLDLFVDAQRRLVMPEASREDFGRWGAYEGSGARMQGRLKNFLPGTIRVFSFSDPRRSFVVFSMMCTEDRARVEPGFDLIETSFRMKP
jgi:hypothetical protein